MKDVKEIKKILLIEDNRGDARLLEEMLKDSPGFSFKLIWAMKLEIGLRHLKDEEISIVLLDLGLPDSEGFETFKKIRTAVPDVPIIVMTGLDDEKLAVDAVRDGAQDYIVKGQGADANLLIRAIRYAIERKKLEIEREKMIETLQDALAKIKTLSGLLPICSFCKKIRDDKGYWNQIEVYVREHSDANFSHSICPECAKKHYPNLYKELKEEPQKQGK